MDLDGLFIEKILYPAMKRTKGNHTLDYLDEFKDNQFLEQTELRMLQEQKLRKLLLECIKNIKAYQKYQGLENLIEEDPFIALESFPILGKKHFRENFDDFINLTMPTEERIQNYSGGSSGQKTLFYMDRKTVEHYEAARWRGLSWYGITPWSRSVMLWGNSIELNRKNQKKYEFRERWLKNRILLSAFRLDAESVSEYIKKINKFKPEYIYGYASALYTMAMLMNEMNKSLDIKLKAVVSTAETLHDFQREEIENIFQCNVVNEYGARDGGILAYQCKYGNLHISAENAIIEVIDPNTMEKAPYGKSGSIVVTDLNNFIMPRLRYRLGDEVVLTDKICDCGIKLPVMESIRGRDNEMLQTPDGTLLHSYLLVKLSMDNPSIEKVQAIQQTPESVDLYIKLKKNGSEDVANLFVKELQAYLEGVKINVIFSNEIAPAPSGKFSYVIGIDRFGH